MAKKGFTLLEMMVALGIAAFLLVLAVVNYHSYYARQIAYTTAESIRSDLDFTIQHAIKVGVASPSIKFNISNESFQVVDTGGIVKATSISPSLLVAVSGFHNKNQASGASADIAPGGLWLGFTTQGQTLDSQPALIVIAEGATWFMVAVNGKTGGISGPTNNRADIALDSTDLKKLLTPGPTVSAGPFVVFGLTINNVPNPVLQTIKKNWGL